MSGRFQGAGELSSEIELRPGKQGVWGAGWVWGRSESLVQTSSLCVFLEVSEPCLPVTWLLPSYYGNRVPKDATWAAHLGPRA